MKKDIHPKFYAPIKITCSKCKAVFTIGATQENLPLSMCSQCHPAYSGKNTYADTANRISRFKNRQLKIGSTKSKKAFKPKTVAKPTTVAKSEKASK